MSFFDISHMPKCEFYKLVETKINSMAFQYLTSKIKSKGSEINYGKYLKCQQYLLPNSFLTIDDQREIFSYRTRMNNINHKFSTNKDIQYCVCGKQITNAHLYYCEILNNEVRNIPYNKIFNGTISEQKQVLNILRTNIRIFRENSECPDVNIFEPLIC